MKALRPGNLVALRLDKAVVCLGKTVQLLLPREANLSSEMHRLPLLVRRRREVLDRANRFSGSLRRNQVIYSGG